MATDNAPQPNQPRPTNQQTTGQTGAQAPGDDDGDLEQSRQSAFLLFLAVPSWLVSVLFHIVLVLILAMLVIPGVIEDEDTGMVMGPKEDAIEETEELVEEEFEEIEVDSEAIADVAPDASETPVPETADISPANDLSAAPAKVELNPLGEQAAPKTTCWRPSVLIPVLESMVEVLHHVVPWFKVVVAPRGAKPRWPWLSGGSRIIRLPMEAGLLIMPRHLAATHAAEIRVPV